MNRTTVHFRCPRCKRQHSVAAARAGQLFVCSTCFGPMLVPEAAGVAPAEIPFAHLIEHPPPSAATCPSDPQVLDVVPEPGADDDQEWEDSVPPDEWSGPLQHEEGSPARMMPLERVGKGAVAAVVGLIVALGAIAVLSRPRRPGDEGLRVASAPPTTRPVVAGGSERARNSTPGADTHGTPRAPRAARNIPPTPAIIAAPPPRPTVAVNPVALPRSADPPMPLPPEPKRQQASAAHAGPIALRPHLPGPDEASAPPAQPPARAIMSRRRQTLDQEALRRQLARLPEASLLRSTADALLTTQGTLLAPPQGRISSLGPLALFGWKQPELAYLPWRMGDDCHLGREPAEDLQVHSRALRDLLQETTPTGEIRPDPERLRARLIVGDARPDARRPRSRPSWVEAAVIPALLQLLTAERTPTRLVLVDVLTEIPGKEATAALARLALFDIASEVRDRAILSLRGRPAKDYRPTLLGGLRYPWPPAADHAAEALVALEDRGAIPDLVKMMDAQDPQGPTIEKRNGRYISVVRSLVRINHLRNCVLCHAASTSPTTDLVRGRVPTPDQPLPPPKQYYAESSSGLFVRADVTYLRQDFSVTQTVEDSAPWPSYQRYDYLVSERLLPVREPLKKEAYPQRESVFFALRELTGKDAAMTSEAWRAALQDGSAGPPGRPPGD